MTPPKYVWVFECVSVSLFVSSPVSVSVSVPSVTLTGGTQSGNDDGVQV